MHYFEFDSECPCLLIQTQLSYMLNLTILRTVTRQSGTEAEVIEMTKQRRTMEISDVLSTMTLETDSAEKTEKLDDLLVNVVDETLKQIFKETGAKVIYDYLENNSHLKREEIAEKPEVFSLGLQRLLGSATPVIERLILKNLYSRLELNFRERRGYEFSDYVKELRKGAISKG